MRTMLRAPRNLAFTSFRVLFVTACSFYCVLVGGSLSPETALEHQDFTLIKNNDRSLQHMTEYGPLQCNIDASIDIDTNECLSSAVNFSTLLSTLSSTPVTIPCGICVIMDYENGSTVHIPGGLNVLGRLHFPSSANVILKTTFVFVQGIWSMEIPTEGNLVKITLYGIEDQFLYPHDLCGTISNIFDVPCKHKKKFGRKPFVVAGGKYCYASCTYY